MTLLEIIECAKEGETGDDWVLQAWFAMSGALRSWHQGEPSTFEDECSGIVAVFERIGVITTAAAMERFIAEHPGLMAVDVPDDVLRRWACADEEPTP